MKLNTNETFYIIAEYYGDEFQGFVSIDQDKDKLLNKVKDFKSKGKTQYILLECNTKDLQTL